MNPFLFAPSVWAEAFRAGWKTPFSEFVASGGLTLTVSVPTRLIRLHGDRVALTFRVESAEEPTFDSAKPWLSESARAVWLVETGPLDKSRTPEGWRAEQQIIIEPMVPGTPMPIGFEPRSIILAGRADPVVLALPNLSFRVETARADATQASIDQLRGVTAPVPFGPDPEPITSGGPNWILWGLFVGLALAWLMWDRRRARLVRPAPAISPPTPVERFDAADGDPEVVLSVIRERLVDRSEPADLPRWLAEIDAARFGLVPRSLPIPSRQAIRAWLQGDAEGSAT